MRKGEREIGGEKRRGKREDGGNQNMSQKGKGSVQKRLKEVGGHQHCEPPLCPFSIHLTRLSCWRLFESNSRDID